MTSTGFLLAEDSALKARLSNITVTDDRNASRPVSVFFRYPESEKEKKYPFITIEMVGLSHAKSRQHSEHSLYYSSPLADHPRSMSDPSYIGYSPSELDGDGMEALLGGNVNSFLRVEAPIPVDLMYQVSTYTRSALHDRQITAQLLKNVIPFRSNYLIVEADQTVRRLDLLGWTQADLLDMEAGYRKRTFRKVYTLMINAEIMREDFVQIEQVTSVVGSINGITDVANADNPIFTEEF